MNVDSMSKTGSSLYINSVIASFTECNVCTHNCFLQSKFLFAKLLCFWFKFVTLTIFNEHKYQFLLQFQAPTENFKFGTESATSVEEMFQNSQDPVLNNMLKFMEKYLVNKTIEGFELVEQGQVLPLEGQFLNYRNKLIYYHYYFCYDYYSIWFFKFFGIIRFDSVTKQSENITIEKTISTEYK